MDGLAAKATILSTVLGFVGGEILFGLDGDVEKVLALVFLRHGGGMYG